MLSNLYLIITFFQPTLFFSDFITLNFYIVDMWYLCLCHLRKQNIVKLAEMSKSINLIQSSPFDACIFYTYDTYKLNLILILYSKAKVD